jgi:hypothetical protein
MLQALKMVRLADETFGPIPIKQGKTAKYSATNGMSDGHPKASQDREVPPNLLPES